MDTGYSHCQALAEKIRNIYADGFEADRAAAHFINSTFDYPDHQRLQSILSDADSSDRYSLIDLIVSPDSAVCCSMEAFLGRFTVAESDIQDVISLLPNDMQTSVRVPGLPEAVWFSVPVSGTRRFLSQLKLTRTIDPGIRAALESRLPVRSDRLTALVGIRHSRLVLTETRKSFLLRFIRQSGRVENDRWLFYFNFILDLLDRQKTDQDVFAVLGAEKQHCLKQVENSRRLTEQLAKNNMETLMLQGARIGLSCDVARLFQNIQTIDEISRLVWGRTPVVNTSEIQETKVVSSLLFRGNIDLYPFS